MDIPNPADLAWREILLGNRDFEFESLSLRILIRRLKLKVQLDQTGQALESATGSLRNFIIEKSSLQSVQKDLSIIFQEEG
jgi:hypothetical protein